MMDTAFTFCLNTSTIKGQGLSLREMVALTAEVGYDGIEPWISELDAFTAGGGSISDLGKEIADHGLAVENLIGFFEWGVDDPQRRQAGIDEARRNLEMAQQIGCKRLAAPPMGLVDVVNGDLTRLAERYAELLILARDYGVVPVLEFWGVSKTLGKLSEAMLVAVECGERDACVLADVFHIYKSGASHNGIRLLGPDTLGLVHVNDYPAEPPRDEIGDAERVYPGDGVAPLATFFADLANVGYRGALSLELFNESYWQHDARDVLTVGLAKTKAAVATALG